MYGLEVTYEYTYDAIGNPLTYIDGRTFTWMDGRKLATITQGEDSISYTYDVNGLRNAKTVNDNTTTYYWLNGSLQGQKTGEEYIQFLHDESGIIYGFTIKNGTNETTYYYDFNLQGDVVAILDEEGTKVVEYSYDVWGNPVAITGTLADTIGQKNPIRYRGYYYDSETGFYYLKSRYYDPVIGRFLNADGYVSTGQDITGFNMFAYCGNNSVNRRDPMGEGWITALIVTAVVAVCTVILSGCSTEPTSVVGIVLVGMHYNRNILNKTDYTEQELLKENYESEKEDKDKFHQNNQKDGKRNRKYVIGDWFSSEIVYYSDGTINNTPEDRGTFNLYSGDNGFLNVVVHGLGDVVPYMIWGNSIDDSTTIVDRFMMIGE